jgi:integrase
MARSKRQFGAVDKLPSGRWRVRYRDAAGRRITAPGTFSSKADASACLAITQADLVRGQYVDPNRGRVTVEEWSRSWLGRAGKRAATVARDSQGIDVFLPRLGTTALGGLTPRLIQEAVDERSARAKPATVARDFAALRAMLNAAVDADLIARSPARRIALPRITRSDRMTLTPEQLRRLVEEVPPHYRALVLTAGVLGLSWEEAVALRVRDVDFMRRTLTVAQTIEELAGHLRVVPEAKRRTRLRTMTVPPFVPDAIAEHLAGGSGGPEPDSLIFVGPRGGMLRRRFGERILRPAAARAGLEGLTFHGLRHAATSALVDVGIHPRVMATRMGHGTIRTTMEVYAHASDSADRDAAKRLQKRFQSAFRGDPRRDPNVTHGRENLGHDGSRTVNKGQTPNPPQGSDQEVRIIGSQRGAAP